MSTRSRLFGAQLGITRPTYTMYPVTGGGNTPGAVVTPGATIFGNYADIIAAKAIATEFWLMEAVFDTFVNAWGLRAVEIYNTNELRTVYQCRVIVVAGTVNLTPFPMSIPIYCAPLDQIQARCGSTNAADLIGVSLLVATGL